MESSWCIRVSWRCTWKNFVCFSLTYLFVFSLYGKQFVAGVSVVMVVDTWFSYLMHNGIYYLFGAFLVFLKPMFFFVVATLHMETFCTIVSLAI